MKLIKNFALSLLFILAVVACSLPMETANENRILFEDNFSDVESGWDQMNEEDFSTDYYEGYYRIKINTEDYMAWANPGKNYTDTSIEVDATFIGGGLDNHFGVICRAEDTDNFYVLMISSDGFFAITKRIDGEPLSILAHTQFEYSEAILQGVISNHIQADCVGDLLSLTVNGELLLKVQDSSLSKGDVGLLAGTFSETDTEIVFDNFIVSAP